MKRIAVIAIAVSALGLLGSACNGFPNTPNGDAAGLARGATTHVPQITRASNPPWALPGGYDCWNYVNWVMDNAESGGIPGWHDLTGPNNARQLSFDWQGPRVGDIVTFQYAGSTDMAYVAHMGVVTDVTPGDITVSEWNSPENQQALIYNQHPNSWTVAGPDGLVMNGVYHP